MIGKTISHYKILEKLGEGGMGVVYKAEDLKLDRSVALKFLPHELTRGPDAKRRFVHEAKAASALQHNNICTVHEIDETDDGRMFISMDCYQGETLKQKIARGPVPVDQAVDIVRQVTEGLAKAHEAGMVHRDIKPANIMITRDGVVKILDFGLAKLAGQTKVTKTGTTVGTVAYMSPEQARGEGIDHRTDIWSLGVVTYEMLTGQLPFRGDHEQAVTYQIVHEDPEPMTALRTGIPMELERIVNKCLEKKSSDRYQHADELVVDLRKAKRVPTPKPRTNRIKYAAVAVTVVILAAIAWKLLRQDTAVSPTEDIAVAVVDFRELGAPDDVTRSVGITSLVQVGLVESSPCRVVSPQYLYDLRRRLFGAGRGPIQEDEALEVARKSGAAMLLSGQMVTLGAKPYVTWQLVDTRSGKSLGARRVAGDNLATTADHIIADVLPLLAKECGVEEPTLPPPVSALTTASPEAYEHYIAGMLAREAWVAQDAVREFKEAVKLDSTFALAYYELSRVYRRMAGIPQPKLTQDYAEKAWKYRARLGIKDLLRLEAWREELDNRIPDAIAIYREMLTRWPDDRELLKELSYTLYHHWYLDEALAVARQGIALYPDERRFVDLYAMSLGWLGRPGEALEISRSYAEQHPGDAEAWVEVAQHYLEMALPDSAEAAARRALEIGTKSFYAQRFISFCHYYRGNTQQAIENHKRLLAQGDLLAGLRVALLTGVVWPDLPVLYTESGRFKKALELFEEARQFVSDPESEFTIESRRYAILLRLGRAEEVLRWARGVAGRSDNRGTLLAAASLKARALVALDSLEAARSAQAEHHALAAGSRASLFPALKLRAEIELAERDPDAALATLHEMKRIGLSPYAGLWSIEWRETLARAHRMAGRLDEAAKVHEEMLRIFRGHTLSHYDLGLIYEEMGRTDDAEREYTAFLRAWAEADEGLPQVLDAKRRLDALKASKS